MFLGEEWELSARRKLTVVPTAKTPGSWRARQGTFSPGALPPRKGPRVTSGEPFTQENTEAGQHHLLGRTRQYTRDPSLRLKNGSVQDDAERKEAPNLDGTVELLQENKQPPKTGRLF